MGRLVGIARMIGEVHGRRPGGDRGVDNCNPLSMSPMQVSQGKLLYGKSLGIRRPRMDGEIRIKQESEGQAAVISTVSSR
jgi:hypothetical protein